ncbi:MAG: DedA family protein [Bdellovibrionaceae bacterium]|nr:DedA family protein [Pseudobdellovibrionaceae bacterium]
MIDFNFADWVQQTFAQLAYMPWAVYGAICGFMILSAFGLPLPEEVILVSAGFVGHLALFPLEPHPPGANVLNVHVLAAVSFFAVMGSDYLIYFLGHRFGPRLFEMKWFSRMISNDRLSKVKGWMQKYGFWPVIVFRFTPGVRFPGHLMCGAMGLSPWKFLAVDAIAAGISVPTQIYFVSYYGKEILQYFGQAKLYLFTVLAVVLVVFILKKWREQKAQQKHI